MVVTCNDPERRKPAKSLSEAEKEELIERLGGAEAIRQSLAEFREVNRRMDRERTTLTVKHPNKWVLMGKDGPLAFGDTFEEVREYARANGLGNPHVVIEYLDTDPPTMIL